MCYFSDRAVIAWPFTVALLLHLSALEARCDRATSAAFVRIPFFQIHC
jgi:hypothetical protein